MFVKGCVFLPFAKNLGKNISKNITKNLSVKYSPGVLAIRQKLLHRAKKSAADALKASSKRVIQKTAEATSNLIGNKIANRIRIEIELQKFQKNHNKIIQRQLQMSMIKKY